SGVDLERDAGKLTVVQTKRDLDTTPVVINPPEVMPLMNIAAYSNNIGFELDHQEQDAAALDEWPEYSEFEIRIPVALTDYRARPLVGCDAAPACNKVLDAGGDYYSWIFETTNKTETTLPELDVAYPALSGAAGYPDTNVSRVAPFTLEFSEQIYVASIIDSGHPATGSIVVKRIVSDTDATVLETIPEIEFDISLIPNSIGRYAFALNETHIAGDGEVGAFEAFSWYKITVQNITDMCGNIMAGPVEWIFRTNDNLPGVESVYPPNEYALSCPTTRVAITFKTSMFDIQDADCAVHPTDPLLSAGYVLSGSGVPDRDLEVQDPVAGHPRPHERCKQYAFDPVPVNENDPGALPADATHSPIVDYYDISDNTAKSHGPWSFDVVPASVCVDPPYISRVQKSQGKWGQCLTVSGWGFGATKNANDTSVTKLITDLNRSRRNQTIEEARRRRSFLLEQTIIDYWEIGAGANGFDFRNIGFWSEDIIRA
ncbi:MAG: Ig-like domain-containing protein, partial [Anaerolineales bacterium]|nr:Ig-like domain-containing protein [Anaerolineales bacterium]